MSESNSNTAVVDAPVDPIEFNSGEPVVEQVTSQPVPDAPVPAAQPEQPPENPLANVNVDMARAIASNMVAVYTTVRRPTARPKAKTESIEVKGNDGNAIEVDTKDLTAPCWKADFHPIWREIDATKTKVDKILEKFSANDSQKGEHLVSMVVVAQMLAELDAVRDERRAIVQRLRDIWDTEILPGIREKKPQHADQIIAGLPSKYRLMEAFDVLWTLRPLTPVTGEGIDVSALSGEEARRVVARTNAMIDDAFKQRFVNIFDDVFGQIAEACKKIEDDGLGGGRRNQASIDSLLSVLDRVQHFQQFASPEVLQQVRNVSKVLRETSVQDINKHEEVRNNIRDAFRPLAKAVDDLTTQQIGGGRSNRSVNI